MGSVPDIMLFLGISYHCFHYLKGPKMRSFPSNFPKSLRRWTSLLINYDRTSQESSIIEGGISTPSIDSGGFRVRADIRTGLARGHFRFPTTVNKNL